MIPRSKLIATVLSGGGASGPVTLTLQPDETTGLDTHIDLSTPTTNYGIGALISAGLTAAAGSTRRGLIMFSGLSSIPASATIISATLTLYCTSETNTTDRAVGAHRALTQWYEGAKNNEVPDGGQDGSTWNLRNANGAVVWAGGAGGASGSDWAAVATDSVTITAPATAFDWDVTADVQDFVDGTASNFGWWLINAVESTGTRKNFVPSGGATESQRPKLVVVYQA